MKLHDFSQRELQRKHRAEKLLIYQYFEKLSQADCWYKATSATPATISRDSAARSARREMDWHRATFPADIDSALIVNRMDENSVFAALADTMFNATTTRREGPDGEYVVVPDARVRLEAIKVWAMLRGFKPGARPRVVSLHPEHREAAAQQEAQEAKEVERADGSRRDINDLKAYPLVSHEESKRQWKEAEAASEPPPIIRELMEKENSPPGEPVTSPTDKVETLPTGQSVSSDTHVIDLAPPSDFGARPPGGLKRYGSRYGSYRVLEGPVAEVRPW